MDNIIIRELDPTEQSEARALIHHNCPVAGQLMSYSKDAEKIDTFTQIFTQNGYKVPDLHTIVLGAYTTDGKLVGALNMNSLLYILEGPIDNPQSIEQFNTVMRMFHGGVLDGIFIDNIGVDLEYRRQGIGQALIEQALSIAKDRLGLHSAALASTAPAATKFFQKMGFTLCKDGLPASFFGGIGSLQLERHYTALGMYYMLKEL